MDIIVMVVIDLSIISATLITMYYIGKKQGNSGKKHNFFESRKKLFVAIGILTFLFYSSGTFKNIALFLYG